MDEKKWEWIPVRQAVAEVAAGYHEALKSDYPLAREGAIDAIWRRLEYGAMRARSWFFRFSFESPGLPSEHSETSGEQREIPASFWRWMREATRLEQCDWVIGDFSFYVDGDEELGESDEGYAELQWAHGYAIEIEIARLGFPFADNKGALTDSQAMKDAETRHQDNRKLRPLPDAALESWWHWQTDETRALGHDDLWDLCKASFPRNTVSRDRVRGLDPDRKRGPKPIR